MVCVCGSCCLVRPKQKSQNKVLCFGRVLLLAMASRSTLMEDILINSVRENPAILDDSLSEQEVEDAWQRIAKECKTTPRQCKSKWTALVLEFEGARKMVIDSGSGCKPFIHWEAMQFLIKEGTAQVQTLSSVSGSPTTDHPSSDAPNIVPEEVPDTQDPFRGLLSPPARRRTRTASETVMSKFTVAADLVTECLKKPESIDYTLGLEIGKTLHSMPDGPEKMKFRQLFMKHLCDMELSILSLKK